MATFEQCLKERRFFMSSHREEARKQDLGSLQALSGPASMDWPVTGDKTGEGSKG